MDTKFCSKCGIEKPATVEWFSVNNANRDGLKVQCKRCDKKYKENNRKKTQEQRKEYYEKNKEKILKHIKNYYENNKEKKQKYRKNNIEKLTKEKKIYYEAHKGKLKEYMKNYRVNNREKRKQYAKNNPDQFKKYDQCKRARKKSLPSTLTLSQWQSTKDHFNHECAYCGKQFKNLAQEHVIPLSKGGGYTKGNIVPSCKSCNSSKNASNMKTWYTTQTYFSIERYNKILAFIKEHKSIHDYTPITKEVTK